MGTAVAAFILSGLIGITASVYYCAKFHIETVPRPGHQRHPDGPAGLHFEGALGDQAAERLAHRRQADAERAGDEAEGELLPWGKAPCRQCLAQRIVDLRAQRGVGHGGTIAQGARFVITKFVDAHSFGLYSPL